MKVLVVEDSEAKLSAILDCLLSDADLTAEEVVVVDNAVSARKELRATAFDLLVLDLMLPNRRGEDADPRGGLDLLREISERGGYFVPSHVLGITAYENLQTAVGPDFLELAWPLFTYSDRLDHWRRALVHKVRHIRTSERDRSAAFDVDVCLLTALHYPELSSVLELDWDWTTLSVPGDHSTYYKGRFVGGGKIRTAVAAAMPRMGVADASVLASKLIGHFRPRLVVMLGIAAGVRDRVRIGDVIAADPTWDYGSGKWTSVSGEPQFEPAPYQYGLAPEIREAIRAITNMPNGLRDWHDAQPAPKPDAAPAIRIGPLATGSAVIAHDKMVVDVIAQNRKLLGLEMEAYGVMTAAMECTSPRPKGVVLKGVSDLADAQKSDDFQPYAARASVETLRRLLTYEFDRIVGSS